MNSTIRDHKESYQLSAISYQQKQIPGAIRLLLQQIGQLAQACGMSAYAVGGCVRDWLLHKSHVTDLDIAVEGDAIGFAHNLATHFHGRVMDIHEQFGTATCMISLKADSRKLKAQQIQIDVAMCRKETYAKPAAYPRVSPGALKDDLRRRDFTINAMAIALAPRGHGRLIDPFNGRHDLRVGVLRVMHPKSFLDDPSRIVRGVRFAERFHLRWEPRTYRLVQQAMTAGALGRLNAGRMRKELERVIEEPNPRACLEHLISLFH